MWSYLKVILWGLLWVPIGLITLIPFKRKGDNCLSYALRKWDTDGGYLVIRWCRSNRLGWFKWPHFLWLSEDHNSHLVHIIPSDDSMLHDPKHTIPSPWFKAKVVTGDPVDDENLEN